MLQRLSFNTLKQRKVNITDKQGKGCRGGGCRAGGEVGGERDILPQILVFCLQTDSPV